MQPSPTRTIPTETARQSLLRRNLLLVASYVAIMALIAGVYV